MVIRRYAQQKKYIWSLHRAKVDLLLPHIRSEGPTRVFLLHSHHSDQPTRWASSTTHYVRTPWCDNSREQTIPDTVTTGSFLETLTHTPC